MHDIAARTFSGNEISNPIATTEQTGGDSQLYRIGRAVTKVTTILGEGASCSVVDFPLEQDHSLLKKGQGLLARRRSFVQKRPKVAQTPLPIELREQERVIFDPLAHRIELKYLFR